MTGKLRVFISSTMSDLANERDFVAHKLREFNFEPVNAEEWPARDARPWDQIEEEIKSSDLFVLILGDRYGFVPQAGPGATEGLSATHLEYLAARDTEEMPILVFMKRLDYETAPEDPRRDQFRKEVREWDRGYLTVEFKLARHLAEIVGKSVMATLSDAWMKERVESRAEQVARSAEGISLPPIREPVVVPENVRAALKERRAVLIAGAGMSLEVGLPDARLYSEVLHQLNVEADPDYWRGPGSSLEAVAEDYELATDRSTLISAVSDMMQPAHGAGPGSSHGAAVRLFDTIITTNFDRLFEEAANRKGTGHRQVNRSIDLGIETQIVHLRGSTDDPSSLALTESDLDRDWRSYWWDLRNTLSDSFLVVVGTSLNDPTLMGLLHDRRGAAVEDGCFVAPGIHVAAQRRIQALRLRHVRATAAEFFAAITGGTP